MKKMIGILALLLVAVSLFAACNFTSNSQTTAKDMSHQPEVEAMLSYLSNGELEKAEDLMHTNKEDTSALAQVSAYLDGRKADKLDIQKVNIYTQKKNGETSKQESGTIKLTLDDGETVYLAVAYLENDADEGFASFQLVLGVV